MYEAGSFDDVAGLPEKVKQSVPSKGWGEASRTGLASEEDELSEYSLQSSGLHCCLSGPHDGDS